MQISLTSIFKKKLFNIINLILVIISLLVSCYLLYALYQTKKELKKTQKEATKIASIPTSQSENNVQSFIDLLKKDLDIIGRIKELGYLGSEDREAQEELKKTINKTYGGMKKNLDNLQHMINIQLQMQEVRAIFQKARGFFQGELNELNQPYETAGTQDDKHNLEALVSFMDKYLKYCDTYDTMKKQIDDKTKIEISINKDTINIYEAPDLINARNFLTTYAFILKGSFEYQDKIAKLQADPQITADQKNELKEILKLFSNVYKERLKLVGNIKNDKIPKLFRDVKP